MIIEKKRPRGVGNLGRHRVRQNYYCTKREAMAQYLAECRDISK